MTSADQAQFIINLLDCAILVMACNIGFHIGVSQARISHLGGRFLDTSSDHREVGVILSHQLKAVKELRAKHETVISNQIGRSATSICANIAESKYGHSRADFVAKLEIALKEANETGRWLEMLFRSDYISEDQYKQLNKTCSTLRILLIASIKTAKENASK